MVQARAVELSQEPLMGVAQSPLYSEQLVALVPPLDPSQCQVRFVPQEVEPLSFEAVPVVQARAVELLQEPLTGATAVNEYEISAEA